jgi:hypothetical protein
MHIFMLTLDQLMVCYFWMRAKPWFLTSYLLFSGVTIHAKQCNNGGTWLAWLVHENTGLSYRSNAGTYASVIYSFGLTVLIYISYPVLTLCCLHPKLSKIQCFTLVCGTLIREIILQLLSNVLSKFWEDIDTYFCRRSYVKPN